MEIQLRTSFDNQKTYRLKIASDKEDVKSLKRRIRNQILSEERCKGMRIRLIYRGRLMRDKERERDTEIERE